MGRPKWISDKVKMRVSVSGAMRSAIAAEAAEAGISESAVIRTCMLKHFAGSWGVSEEEAAAALGIVLFSK